MVQAKTDSFADLGQRVITASKQPGVVAISNSYGGGDAPDTTYGTYYNHPGIAVTASTGDNGYQGGELPGVLALHDRRRRHPLAKATNTRGWNETVWNGAGSGCSTYNTALAAAATFGTGCAKRAMADVSAAADPNDRWPGDLLPDEQTVLAPGRSSAAPVSRRRSSPRSTPCRRNTAGYANALPYAHPGSCST